MLRIAIFDKTKIQAEKLSQLLHNFLFVPYEADIFSTEDAFKAHLLCDVCPYHLFFIDVELRENTLDGISLAQKLNEKFSNVQIIFTSQYVSHVSDVYAAKHAYFICNAQLETYLPRALALVLQNFDQMEGQFLHFSRHHEKFHLPARDILYMERILRYTEIHTQAATYPADEKISTLLAQLPPVFCNCHRSFAANLNAASSLTRTELLFPNGQKIPVGRNYYHDVKKHF